MINDDNNDIVEPNNDVIKPQLTNEQKLDYLSRLIKKADQKLETKNKKLIKKDNHQNLDNIDKY